MGPRIREIEEFEIDDEMRDWAAARAPNVCLEDLKDRFVDWHRAKGKRANDYAAAFRNWARKEQESKFGKPKPVSPSRPSPTVLEAPMRGVKSSLKSEVRAKLVAELGDGPVRSWLDGLDFKLDGSMWRATAPSRFARDKIEGLYLDALRRALDGSVQIDAGGK